MPNYMLLFYATPVADQVERDARDADIPEWMELIDALDDEGVLRGHGRLMPVESATTVRIRDRDAEITDGPFATTKEVLAGYFAIECPDLDHALRTAERIPSARYGSVEVRPLA
jgi:hypothetical protein